MSELVDPAISIEQITVTVTEVITDEVAVVEVVETVAESGDVLVDEYQLAGEVIDAVFSEVVTDAPPGAIDTISDTPQFSVEELQVYAKRLDMVGDGTIYRGEAVPGSLDASPVWRIRRLTIAPDDDITEEWVNGSAAFAYVWDDRATYTYR